MNRSIYPVFLPFAGCKGRCIFCQQHSLTGSQSVPAPAEAQLMLEAMLPSAGLGEIAFYGGSFFDLEVGLRQAYLEVAGSFIAQGRASSIRASVRPDSVDSDCLDQFVYYGGQTLELGCQSFDDRVLLACGRGHDARSSRESAVLIKARGLFLGIQLMPGLPAGSDDEAQLSLRTALELGADFLRIYPALVLEGTALAEQYRMGHYDPLSLDAAVDLVADLYAMANQQSVAVIRMGAPLDFSSGVSGVLAGPVHPAFGQLVRSRLWVRTMELYCRQGFDEFRVNPADLSDAQGHRKENLLRLSAMERSPVIIASTQVRRGSLQVADQTSQVILG